MVGVKNEKVVLIYSGGVDSTTLMYKLINDGYKVYALTFDYGQKHKKEIECAKNITDNEYIPHEIVDISSISKILNSALTTETTNIPNGHYTDDVMKKTIVPNRNAIMLSIAFGFAESIGANIVAYAAHAGDHPIYPDCRPDFVKKFIEMIKSSTRNKNFEIYAPFLYLKKDDIVKLGDKLGINFKNTWSCYKGNEKHCGVCGTCNERKEAFELANVEDVEYEI